MPYILTERWQGATHPKPGPNNPTAVATLAEAQDIVAEDLQHFDFDAFPDHPLADGIPTLTDFGGDIGPLPDGTVIEVRWIDWMNFERMVIPGTVAATIPITTFDDDDYRDSLLRAFNAA
jgi:hypothetical protein